MTEEELIERALDGDGAALSELCERLAGPVFRLAWRMLGDRSEAEDATQDVLIKVITNLSQFERRSALSTWVHRIAVRHVLAMKMSRGEMRALDEQQFAERLELGLAIGRAAAPPAPEELVLMQEIRLTCTQAMLMMLSREERLAVVLAEVLELPGPQAAEVAEVSEDTFRQRLSRGRARLSKFLEARCGLVNEAAECRCDRQIPAKKVAGLSVANRSLSVLAPSRDEGIAQAARELRAVRGAVGVFHLDGTLRAPREVHERLIAMLPALKLGPLAR